MSKYIKVKLAEARAIIESQERLDEISKKTVTSFLDKTEPENDFVSGPSGKQGHEKGRKLAFSKLSRQPRAKVPATEEAELGEAAYSAKAAKAGKDIGKPGKNFAKIEKSASKEYGSKESGKKVAGAILAKIRAKHMGEEAIEEAKAPSPIAGTRLISRHAGMDGHHAEVRYSPDYQEYQVHHYNHGKHLGEGPVSYHGDGKEGKEDAEHVANHSTTFFKVKGNSLHVREEVENLDEISKKTADSYHTKSQNDLDSAYWNDRKEPEETRYKRHDKRISGIDAVRSKMSGTAKVPATEEVENLDELSKKTLMNYAGKAAPQSWHSSPVDNKTMKKRSAGIDLAYAKARPDLWAQREYSYKLRRPAAKVLATEETETCMTDTSNGGADNITNSKTGENYKTTKEKTTAPSKPTGTSTHVVAGKTGEAYNTTSLTKRIPAVESAIMDIMRQNVDLRRIQLEASHLTITSPEQRTDWAQVEQGKMDVVTYFTKYKV